MKHFSSEDPSSSDLGSEGRGCDLRSETADLKNQELFLCLLKLRNTIDAGLQAQTRIEGIDLIFEKDAKPGYSKTIHLSRSSETRVSGS